MTTPPTRTPDVISTLKELLERVEKAEENAPGLFLRVLHELTPQDEWRANYSHLVAAGAYTDAALALCDRVLPGRHWLLAWPGYDYGVYQDGKAMARIHHELSSGGNYEQAFAKTPALALLSAMLQALISEGGIRTAEPMVQPSSHVSHTRGNTDEE